jgi:hypothetical protein
MAAHQSAGRPVNLELGAVYQCTRQEVGALLSDKSLSSFSVGAFARRRVRLPDAVLLEQTRVHVVPEIGALYTPYSGASALANSVTLQAALGLSLVPAESLFFMLEPSVAYNIETEAPTPGVALGLLFVL